MFALSDEHAYLISTMNNFAAKKLLKVGPHQKIVLKIWYIENEALQQNVENFYHKIGNKMKHIDFFAVNESTNEVIIATNKIEEIKRIAKHEDLKVNVYSSENFKNRIDQFAGTTIIYNNFSNKTKIAN